HRQHPDPAVRRRPRQPPPAARLVVVRGVPGGLPGEDQHPAHAHRPARAATRGETGLLARAGLPGLDGGAAAAVALPPGAAGGPAGAAAAGAGRLAAPPAGARRRLDRGARLPGAGGAVVPREVDGDGLVRAGSVSDGPGWPSLTLPARAGHPWGL